MRAPIHVALLAAPALAFATAMTQPATLALGRPLGTSPSEFTRISDFLEIGRGVVAVYDERERRLDLLDFNRGTAQAIARRGSGPGEYRAVGRILPRRGGGAWITDFANRRLLGIDARGVADTTIPFPQTQAIFQATDDAGRLYGDQMIFRDRELLDTAHVVRWAPGSPRVDTLFAFDAGRAGMIVHRGEAHRVWRPTTSWTALPDGAIALLSADPYALEVRGPSGPARRVTLPFERVTVTAGDREAYARIDSATSGPPMALGQPGARTTAPPPRPTTAFPATYPAFDPDAQLRRSPDGLLWIERLGRPGAPTVSWDAITTAGALVARLTLPAGSSIAGFGEGALYVAVSDSDDVRRIVRYPMPAVPARR